MAVDYSREIIALKKAIGSGAKRVIFDGRSVEYPDFAELLARLRFLEDQQLEAQGITPTPRCFIRTTFNRDEF